MKPPIAAFVLLKLLVACVGQSQSTDSALIVVDTHGRRCTPVYLGSPRVARLHVAIEELEGRVCPPELLRLHGSGDGVHGSPCNGSPGSEARSPFTSSRVTSPPFVELFSECKYPVNVTLRVISNPLPSSFIPSLTAAMGYGLGTQQLGNSRPEIPTLDQEGDAFKRDPPKWSRKLQQGVGAVPQAGSSTQVVSEGAPQQAQQQAPATEDSMLGSDGSTNSSSTDSSSVNSNSTNSSSQDGGSGSWAEAGMSPLPSPLLPPPPPPNPDEALVCCCWRSDRVYPFDNPPHGGCCCGTFKECCKPKFTPFAFCNNSTGCIVGLGVGLVVFAVVCTAVAIWLMWKRRTRISRQRRNRSGDSLAVLSNLKEEELEGKTVTPPTLDQLGTTLECPVCLEMVTVTATNWIIFPCSDTHGMCSGCLADMIKHNARHPRQRHVIQCPLCRKMAVGRVRGGVRLGGGAGGSSEAAAAPDPSLSAAAAQAHTEVPGNLGISVDAAESDAASGSRRGAAAPGSSRGGAVELSSVEGGAGRAPSAGAAS